MRTLQRWLWRTQKWPARRVREYQDRQLFRLLQHAAREVPFYGGRIPANADGRVDGISQELWEEIPLLTRRDIQLAGSSIHARNIPAAHGRTFSTLTGGSTGQPVQTIGTARTAYIWQALTIRDHIWHSRDLTKKLATIRHTSAAAALPPLGKEAPNWGSSMAPFLTTGPGALLSIDSTVEQQADWLIRQKPGYLLSYPSSTQALANFFHGACEELPGLLQVRTFGEILEPAVRAACEAAWGTPVVDLYSSQELGYIALQCPENTHYHVQEESVRVEVLDDDGRPCRPGEVGRIVVTSLHNFAMPLIRYEIGDFAEVGEKCSCGRNLLVLKRILGRQRNMLLLPDGRQVWPALQIEQAGPMLDSLNYVTQMQVVQTSLDALEVNLVAANPLSEQAERELLRFIGGCLPAQFEMKLRYVDAVQRSPSGKFEDFRCEVSSS